MGVVIYDCSKLAPAALARPQEHIAASPGPGATGQRVGGLHDGEAEPPHALRAAVISASGARQKCWRRRQHRAPPSAELPPATAGLSPGGMGREEISRTGGGTRFVARSRSRSTCLQGTLSTPRGTGFELHEPAASGCCAEQGFDGYHRGTCGQQQTCVDHTGSADSASPRRSTRTSHLAHALCSCVFAGEPYLRGRLHGRTVLAVADWRC